MSGHAEMRTALMPERRTMESDRRAPRSHGIATRSEFACFRTEVIQRFFSFTVSFILPAPSAMPVPPQACGSIRRFRHPLLPGWKQHPPAMRQG